MSTYEIEARARDEIVQARGKRSVPENFENDGEEKRPADEAARIIPVSDDSPIMENKPRKRPNYLHHRERCQIIKRIDSGEKQATLAREYRVTRAAISQMYKKREEILARGDPENVSERQADPVEPRPISDRHVGRDASKSRGETLPCQDSEDHAISHPPTLETRSEKAALLLKILRYPKSSPSAFERAARRLTFILIEEALSQFDVQAIGQDRRAEDAAFCGLSLGAESASFETALCQIDTKAQTGQIHVKASPDGWKLQYLDVPDSIADLEILLFSTYGIGGAECKAVEALKRIGVQDQRISLIMVVCSSHGFKEISTTYPAVTIIAATINDKWTPGSGLWPETIVSSLTFAPIKNRSVCRQTHD